MTNIILCGGSGTRLWPISRTLMPKQFIELFDGRSLFQLTVKRNRRAGTALFIVSNNEHFFLASDQLEEVDEQAQRFLLEPVGRNTAPAIALACLALDPEETVLVTPSDHLITDESAYAAALERAKSLAAEGALVTFGITPTFAETGFGYIEAEGENVKAFHEKPDAATAEGYLKAGNYYWNSGMFCFKAGVFLEELRTYAPQILEACEAALESAHDDGMLRIRREAMLAIPEESIDYAVMEHSKRVKVVPSDIGWSDVGSFDALYENLERDDEGNTKSDALLAIESRDNLVIAQDRLVAAVDVSDLIIVDSKDALLVARRGSSQKIKQVVERLKAQESPLPDSHQKMHRPWGTYSVLETAPGYKIKRIVVKPGKRLSLQKHFHRSEHWVVVSGTALVTIGDEQKSVRANESTYIPIGTAHRLENPGRIDLVLIEAQVGEYTGEDDIVRIEDDYQRS